MAHRFRLALVQAVLSGQHIDANGLRAAFLNFFQLCLQSQDEVLQPAGQIHVAAHALQGAIEAATITIVVLANGEQTLEIIAGAIEDERREQARCAAVAIDKGVDVD